MSENFWSIFLIVIIANVTTILLLLIFLWSAYVYLVLKERNRLLKFLGVNTNSPNLNILVSRIEVKPKGSKPTEGEEIENGYVGAAIAKAEYEAADILYKKINPTWLAKIPNRLRDSLSHKFISIARLETKIDVCPKELDEIPKRSNLILIGSSVYNRGTKFYLDYAKNHGFMFAREKDSRGEFKRFIQLCEIGKKPIQIEGRSADRELGIIQKIKNDNGNSIIVCAGLGDETTIECAKYLADKILKIESEYHQKEFGICLGYEIINGNIITSAQPNIVMEVKLERANNIKSK